MPLKKKSKQPSGFMARYGVPEFEDLQTSTKTIMAYSNVTFNLAKIFRSVYITPVEVPLTKKKKNVDKKRLSAPYGAVISVQKGIQFRGIDLRKSKKHWCASNCRQMVQKGKKKVRVNTVIEEPSLKEGSDIYENKYYCTSCNKYYSLRQLGIITNFLNQVTIVLSVGDVLLNVMIFKNNFKIAGCKNDDDAVEAVMILWQDYIRPIPKGWNIEEQFKDEDPRFVFRLVMRNVDFHLGFFIDRRALNKFMNSEKYSDYVFMSQCETTGHTNVNIKMYCHKPEGYKYDCLVFPEDEDPYFDELDKNPYKPKKPKKKRYTTFIVFSSSEIILSGRYDEDMKRNYEFFVTVIMENRKQIEENIKEPEMDLLTFLKKQ